MRKASDVDVETGYYGVAKDGGQMATVVPPNKKCVGCFHYETNRVMCLKGLAPKSCGAGADPEQGYAPMMPDAQSYQEWRQKKGLEFTAPTAQAGKKEKDARGKGPSYSVEVLGDSKVHKSEAMRWFEKGCELYPEFVKAFYSPGAGKVIEPKDATLWHDPKQFKPTTPAEKAPSGLDVAKPRKAGGSDIASPEHWQPSASGKTHSVTTPEGHSFIIMHHGDGTHSVHIQPKGGKSYPAQTAGSKKAGSNHASFPSHDEAIGEAVKHYHAMTGGAARTSSLARSFSGLMFFQAEVNNFPSTLKKIGRAHV